MCPLYNMTKLEQVLKDPNHPILKDKPKQFDNNYLYYLYCLWSETLQYDDARIYMWENLEQILWQSFVKLKIHKDLFEDIKSEMFIVADNIYTSIFTETRLYDLVKRERKKWVKNAREWEEILDQKTKFERYYLPQQVYWYLKTTLYYKVITMLNADKEVDSMDMLNLWEDWDCEENMCYSSDSISTTTAFEMLLPRITNLDKVSLYIFIAVCLRNQSLSSVAEELNGIWLEYNKQSVHRALKWILATIKEWFEEVWLSPEDFIYYR